MTQKRRKKKKYNKSLFRFSKFEISEEVKKDIIAIFLFVFSLISLLSFVNLAGGLGEKFSSFISILFGWGFILFPILLSAWGWKMIKSKSIFESKSSTLGVTIMVFSILSLFHLFYSLELMFEFAKYGQGGGIIGAVFAWILVSLVGKWGGLIIIFALFLISFLLIFNISFIGLLNKIKFKRSYNINNLDKNNNKEEEYYEDDDGEDDDKQNEDDFKTVLANKKKKEKKGIISSFANKIKKEEKVLKLSVKEIRDEDKNDDFSDNLNQLKEGNKKWTMPSVNLLSGKDSNPTSGDIKANSNIIKRTLAEFNINVEMREVHIGPTVTQYTLKPAVGVKLSRITALQNDLALSLAARSMRIEAPIPGKSLVGIELPNETVAMVGLKNILTSSNFRNRKSNLNIILGRDVAGNEVLADLGKMPHLMIAGSTGSGKTVCVNTLITSLIFQNSPESLKFIMVDPKRVELTPYNDIPYLLTPVIVDPDKAVNSLKWAIKEMENRYETLSQIGCRNIESYNHAVRTKYQQRDVLYYIVIVIDELADLMATHGREVEALIVRLAQMARAVGIHLVLSTQRPSVEVITGLIKANITTRIAFQVASQIDSRTILDMSGAEKLLGSGDMLYLASDSNKPKRIQGVFVSEEEIKSVVNFLKEQKDEEINYNEAITESKKSALDIQDDGNIIDDVLYEEAVEVVKNAKKASSSFLQRRLRVGYSRAARLIDLMEEQGVVGPSRGAKAREVYGSEEEKATESEDVEE